MAFTRVQGGNAAASAVTIAAVSSGSTICGAYSFDNGGTFTTVTDNQGNTYSVVVNILDTTNNQRTIYFALGNITNGPTTITVNGTGSNIFTQIVVDEFSGGDAASNNRDGATGQFQNAPGTGTDAITSGAIVTTQAGDLIWGACVRPISATQPTVGTGFTVGASENGSGYALRSEFLTQGAAGSVAATFTQGTASQTMTGVIAIKAPSAAFTYVPSPFAEPPRNNTIAKKAAIALIASGAVIGPFALTQPETVTESRWHQGWSEPVRYKQAPKARISLMASGGVVPLGVEAITPDKWFNPYSEPGRFKQGLRASLQQATTLNPFGMTQAESVSEDKWHQAWSEPVRIKPGLKVYLQKTTAFSETPVRVVVESEFHYPWSEPVRKKPLLHAALNQFLAHSPTLPPVIYSWIPQLSEPVRVKLALGARYQQFFTADTKVIPDSKYTLWYAPLSEPVRLKPRLRAGLNPPFFFYPDPLPNPAADQEDRWHQPWSEPVRKKPRALMAASGLYFVKAAPFGETITEDKWHQSWSLPVRIKPGMYAWRQRDFTIDAQIRPPPVPSIGYFMAFSQPYLVREMKLIPPEFFWEPRTLPPPFVTVTMTMATTEINSDVAEFGVNVSDPEPTPPSLEGASVAIVEIPANQDGAVSIREP